MKINFTKREEYIMSIYRTELESLRSKISKLELEIAINKKKEWKTGKIIKKHNLTNC